MDIFHGIEGAGIRRPTVLTLGVFDGLHLGHQAIVRTVVERALLIGATPTLITFDPHPRQVLKPETAPPLLQTFNQKMEGLRGLGIEQVIVLEFNRQLAALPAEEFVRQYVVDGLQAHEVYLGKGFAFGHNRQGNIELLQVLSRQLGFYAAEVPEVRLRGHRISSTMVRMLLKAGRVNVARRMLGRPYGVEGRVVRGDERGRTIGFPTANLRPANRVIPRRGVYVTATLIDGHWRRSVTNVGVRPTFDGVRRTVEAYLLDFGDGDLYGDVVRVRFLHRLRSEQRFASAEELKRQIDTDVLRAHKFFERAGVRRTLSVI